jgi:aspartyl protease family protein
MLGLRREECAMNTCVRLMCLAAVLWSPVVLADVSQPVSLMTVTELKTDKSGHFRTTASINGTDVKVLVDTGATVVALSFEDAEDVGLRPRNLDFNVPVSTANGVAKAAAVTLESVDIDGVAVEGVAGLVMPEGALKGTLLGMSFLGRLSGFKVEDGVLHLRE